jgi:hypothetical protein
LKEMPSTRKSKFRSTKIRGFWSTWPNSLRILMKLKIKKEWVYCFMTLMDSNHLYRKGVISHRVNSLNKVIEQQKEPKIIRRLMLKINWTSASTRKEDRWGRIYRIYRTFKITYKNHQTHKKF